METVGYFLLSLSLFVWGISFGIQIGVKRERKWTTIWKDHAEKAHELFRSTDAIMEAFRVYLERHPEHSEELNDLMNQRLKKTSLGLCDGSNFTKGTEPDGEATVCKTE